MPPGGGWNGKMATVREVLQFVATDLEGFLEFQDCPSASGSLVFQNGTVEDMCE